MKGVGVEPGGATNARPAPDSAAEVQDAVRLDEAVGLAQQLGQVSRQFRENLLIVDGGPAVGQVFEFHRPLFGIRRCG